MINFLTLSLFYIFLLKKLPENKNKIIFFIYGWLFGFGYFVSNLYWISISLTFDENFRYLIPFSTILVPGFLSLFYGLISYLFIILKPQKKISSFFLFSIIFGIIEFIRGSILTGFPWNLIAYSFSNQLEILNIISIIGTYSFNLFCISLFTSPSIFILRDNKKEISVCIVFLITTMSFYVYGTQNLEKFNKEQSKKLDYKIRIISSNINIDRFYNNIDPASTIKELIEISSPKKNEKTIFIWPEGIIPGVSQKRLKEYKSLFEDKLQLQLMGSVATINRGLSYSEAFRYAATYNPSSPIYFDSGDFYQPIIFDGFNPLSILELNRHTAENRIMNIGFTGDFAVTEYLNLSTSFNKQMISNREEEYNSYKSFFRGMTQNGDITNIDADRKISFFNSELSYDTQLGNSWLTLGVGMNFEELSYDYAWVDIELAQYRDIPFYLSGDRWIVEDFKTTTLSDNSSFGSETYKNSSIYGSASISFEKLELDGMLRSESYNFLEIIRWIR